MIRASLLAIALALPAAAFATDGVTLTPELEAQVRTLLTEQGYEVRRLDTEDGMIEAYALRDGERYEVYLDAELQIVRTSRED
ncbi:PepSY domain-containing protein [Rhodobacterales bacterium HKCCE2091]|nr:PepSY domain-containing protein [Rhodobacterales bacterium HKCCE2091]